MSESKQSEPMVPVFFREHLEPLVKCAKELAIGLHEFEVAAQLRDAELTLRNKGNPVTADPLGMLIRQIEARLRAENSDPDPRELQARSEWHDPDQPKAA